MSRSHSVLVIGAGTGFKRALSLRRRLAATTILAVAPFLGYGRQAYADCLPPGLPAVTCSGTTVTTQNITTDDANVTTASGFNLTAPAGNGINIQANGHLQFADVNDSPITATNGTGLFVYSTGNSAANAGAITIVTNGDITGGDGDGIYARSNSQTGDHLSITTGPANTITGSDDGIEALNLSGDLTITAHGAVTGETDDGINAFNAGIYDPTGNGRDLTITTTAGSVITGYDDGIFARNNGTGNLSITADGEVTGNALGPTAGYGIYAFNSRNGGDLRITTGVDSVVYGASGGIDVENNGDGDLILEINGQVTSNDNAIDATNDEGFDLTITTGAQSVIRGGTDGITASNRGEGYTEITILGQVTGDDGDGMDVRGISDSKDLTVITGAQSVVTGSENGIDARHTGYGDLVLTINGELTGEDDDGLYAINNTEFGSGNAQNLTISTGAQSNISGGVDGIDARNRGAGDLTITVDGDVTGEDGDGIFATNDYYYDSYSQVGTGFGANLTVTTGAQSVVTGGDDGIDAENYGSGDLTITANGRVTGNGYAGIYAYNSEYGGKLTVTTGVGSVIRGAEIGISAEQEGEGDVVITVNGDVTGENDAGMDVANGEGNKLTIVTGAQSVITGGTDGIDTDNHGYGDLEITANGMVTGLDGDGIVADNSSTSDNQKGLKVTTGAASIVTGSENGIHADNFGGLDVEITVNGVVTGKGANGIYSRNAGDEDTIIKVGATGLVQGNEAGIYARSGFRDAGQDIFITNDGVVRNLSGATFDRAIVTLNGPATIDNNNTLVGTISFLGGFEDTLNNAGLWNTADGLNDFGGSDDEMTNTGTLRAADDPTIDEETSLENLETLNNSGLVTLVDGQTGDVLRLANDGNAPEYIGNDGRLAVDALLAPGGTSDEIRVFGNSSGVTNVVVNLLDPNGSTPNYIGIPVAIVTVNTLDGDFRPEGGVLNAGFFAWDVRLLPDDHTHVLITTGLGAGSYEFAAGITGAQDLWHQTTGTLLQRQADLRALLAGTQMTPVADFSEPVAPTPIGHVTPGLWFKGVGGYLERDQDVANNAVTDRNQEIYGLFGGFDFGSEGAGDAWLFGVFGGYVTSDLDFKSTNSEWDYEGPSLGAYASYLDHAFYADILVKADFLDVDIDASDIAPEADNIDTDVFNIGGQIDTGYKMPLDHGLFIDPQASLAVVHTEVDDIGDVFGGSVDFEDETSVRGRLGLRLGHELTASDQLIYTSDITASVWQEFAGDNDVTVFAPLTPATGISDDPGETYGDVAVGFSVQSPEGWSSFLRANYQFSEDYGAIAGNAGVRYAW